LAGPVPLPDENQYEAPKTKCFGAKKSSFVVRNFKTRKCFGIELRNYFLFATLCFALNQIPTDKSKHQYDSQGMSRFSELNIGYFTLSIPCLVAQCFSIRSLYCVLTVDKFKFMG